MNNTVDRRGFLELAAIVSGAGLLAARGRTRFNSSRASDLRPPNAAFLAELPRLMEAAGVPGVGMAVIQHGKLSWQDYRGVMDSETPKPVTPETLWPAASLSKPAF